MGFLKKQMQQSSVQQPSTYMPSNQVPMPGMTPEMNEQQMAMMNQLMLSNLTGLQTPGDVQGPIPTTGESAALMTNRPRVVPKGYRL